MNKFIFKESIIFPKGISYSVLKDDAAIVVNFIGFSTNKSDGIVENHVSASVMLTKSMANKLIEDINKLIEDINNINKNK